MSNLDTRLGAVEGKVNSNLCSINDVTFTIGCMKEQIDYQEKCMNGLAQSISNAGMILADNRKAIFTTSIFTGVALGFGVFNYIFGIRTRKKLENLEQICAQNCVCLHKNLCKNEDEEV